MTAATAVKAVRCAQFATAAHVGGRPRAAAAGCGKKQSENGTRGRDRGLVGGHALKLWAVHTCRLQHMWGGGRALQQW